jgi:hypothetical protein
LQKINAEIIEFFGVASVKKMTIKKAISESVAVRANRFREVFELAFSQAAANSSCDSNDEFWGETKKANLFFEASKLGSRSIEKNSLSYAIGHLIENQILAIQFLASLDKRRRSTPKNG